MLLPTVMKKLAPFTLIVILDCPFILNPEGAFMVILFTAELLPLSTTNNLY
jgi:hypothetical protein